MEGKHIDDKELMLMAKSKSSFAKCATAGLWVLSGCNGKSDTFDRTQDLFHAGLQILDDL